MICRSGAHYTGPRGALALYALEGINIGFQLGGQATDFVLLVMNPKGAESLLTSKVKLGVDPPRPVGPKGRTAEAATDVVMKAEILSYSRSKGLFAGVSLEGSTLRSDGSANEKLHKQQLSAKDIIRGGKVKALPSAHDLITLLNNKDAKEQIRAQVAAVDGLTWIGPVPKPRDSRSTICASFPRCLGWGRRRPAPMSAA